MRHQLDLRGKLTTRESTHLAIRRHGLLHVLSGSVTGIAHIATENVAHRTSWFNWSPPSQIAVTPVALPSVSTSFQKPKTTYSSSGTTYAIDFVGVGAGGDQWRRQSKVHDPSEREAYHRLNWSAIEQMMLQPGAPQAYVPGTSWKLPSKVS